MPAFPARVARRPTAFAVCLASVVILAMAILALFPVAQRWAGDVRLFEHYVGMTFSGTLGETPFLSWYPPPALIPLGLPLIAGGGWIYAFAFGAEMAAFAAAGSMLLSQLAVGVDRLRRLSVYAALVVVATCLIVWRYDIVPAVFTLAGLGAAAKGRWALAGTAVGIATGLKLYAAILAPLLVVHAWRVEGGAAAVRVAIAGLLVGIASVAAYSFFPDASPLDLLAFTASRPLHLESLVGSGIAALASAGVTEAAVEFGFGSFNIDGPAAESALSVIRIVQPAVIATSLAVGAYAIWRRRLAGDYATLALAWTAALLGLLIANRVLSPQYLLWILPFVPLVGGWLRSTLIGAFVLSAIVFPWLYTALLELHPLPVALVLLRNGLLVIAWVVAMTQLLRSAKGEAMPELQREAAAAHA